MPTYPPAHKRIQFQGTLQQASGGGSEIFDFGFADSGALSIEDVAAAAATRMHAAWSVGSNNLSRYATFTGVRVENVLADGKVGGSYYQAATPVQGASDGAYVTVLSNCLTLETQTPNDHGRTVRGRFYPPGYCGSLGATTDLPTLMTYAQSWASVLNGMIQDGIVPAVASVTAGGQIAEVTDISAGTVIDTVRRRRNHVTVQRTPKYSVDVS